MNNNGCTCTTTFVIFNLVFFSTFSKSDIINSISVKSQALSIHVVCMAQHLCLKTWNNIPMHNQTKNSKF